MTSDRPLVEIAYATGFSSQANFNRAFRKAVGTTPSLFGRRNIGDDPIEPVRSRQTAGIDRPGSKTKAGVFAAALILDAVAMQVVAVGVEPGLGALDMTADPADHPPEPRRMVHLDEMRHLMGGEIVEHIRRRQDQPPRERQ